MIIFAEIMNNIMLKKSVFLLVAALSLSAFSQPDGDGWESIFNGKNLNGWIQMNGTATYRVENGMIIGKTEKGSPSSFLCTKKEYADFELEFEVKYPGAAVNSGVQVRSATKAPEAGQAFGVVNGPQIEIDAGGADGSVSGYIFGESFGKGWMTPDEKRISHKAFKQGEWNLYRIVANGARIQIWINGQLIDDLVDEEVYKTYSKGFIGLQVHGVRDNGPYEVAWRNIRIKVL
jgi:hypothetical protein